MENISTTETGLKYSYSFDENNFDLNDVKLKLISKVPKTNYYSSINEIGNHFDEIILPTLNKNTQCKQN